MEFCFSVQFTTFSFSGKKYPLLQSSRRCETEYVERASESAEVRLWISGMHCKFGAQWCNGGPDEGNINSAQKNDILYLILRMLWCQVSL